MKMQDDIAAAHGDLATARRIYGEQSREKGRQLAAMDAKHTKEIGAFKKKTSALHKEIEETRQEALLQAELLRTEQRKRQVDGGVHGGSIASAVPDRSKDLYHNEYSAGIYTAINGKLEEKGLHAILDTGNASLTMITLKVAKDLGLVTRDGKPNQALKLTQEVRGVVSNASETAWQVHAKIVIRTNDEELVPTTLEGTCLIAPADELGCDILVSAEHIKELQGRGYGGVRC